MRRTSQIVLFTKYYYGDHIMEDEMGGHVTRTKEMRNAYKNLVREPEGKRQRSWGSSVSIVSDYKLEERAIGFRSPATAKHFS
jgi:hypothetical protein